MTDIERIGDFQIEALLGEGGMGKVYRARQISLERLVALKVMSEEYSSNMNYVRRFYREARSAATLNHPHIVQIYSIGTEGKYHYFAMEYVRGETLRQKMQTLRRQDIHIAVKYVRQIAEALQAAHDAGIVHRDIKAGNVMIDTTDNVKVMDFGLVKIIDSKTILTDTGLVLGTAQYMSPEQALGEPLDGRTDIYSLGVLFFELVAGEMPFTAPKPIEIIQKHLHDAPPSPCGMNPALPQTAEDIIMKMLAKKRNDRYKNAGELLKDLQLLERAVKVSSHPKQEAPPPDPLAKTKLAGAPPSPPPAPAAPPSPGPFPMAPSVPPVPPPPPFPMTPPASAPKKVPAVSAEEYRDADLAKLVAVPKEKKTPPAAPVVVAPPAAPPPEESHKRKTPLVLVADDVAYSRLLYKTILGEKGYNIIQAADGEQALKLILQQLPDLVLIDIGMPKMNGLDVIKNAAPTVPNTKFIVISAHKDRDTILQAATQGISGYLTKPVRLEELRQRVNAALEQPVKPTKTFKIADKKVEHDKPFVLVCDQHPSMQSLFKNLLEGEGAEVALVSNPDVALRVLSANYPHLVIIDSELRPGGALPLVKTLRAPGIPKIPLFILADPKDKFWLEKANYYGIRSVLNKPLRLDELKKAYHETINQVEEHHTIPMKKNDILKTLVMQQRNNESAFVMKDFAMLFVNHLEDRDRQTFKQRLEENDEANVRQIIINLLTRKKEQQRLEIINEAYSRGDFKVRYNCLDLLGRFIGVENRVAILSKLVKDPDYRIRMLAAEQLAILPGESVKQAILALVGDEIWQVRKKAIMLLEKVSENLLFRPLITFYAQEKLPFPPKLKSDLARAKSPADLKPIYDILAEDPPEIKEHIIRNLVDVGSELCLQPIIKCLQDSTASVRSTALQAVRVIRRPEVFEAILQMTSDVEAAIRQEAVVYIENYPLQPASKALLVGRARDRQPLDDALIRFIKDNETDQSMLATRLVNMGAIPQEEQHILTELLRRVYDAATTSICLEKLYRGSPNERAEIVQDIVNKIKTSSWTLLP